MYDKYYNCTSYRQYGKNGGTCSAHYVRYDELYVYVLDRVRHRSKKAQASEQELLDEILQSGDRELAAMEKRQKAELTKAEKRKAEVDRLFARMYED